MKRLFIILSCTICLLYASAGDREAIPFGDFENWLARSIHESPVIGGATKTVYEIAPEGTRKGNQPYVNRSASPWATSNILARVAGITKTSNAVSPGRRSDHNRYARLDTKIERCKALGLVNIDVLVAGSIFLGKMFEPITSTNNPYSKMEMGIPFTRRPVALVFDYKVDMPGDDTRIYSSGFGSKKTLKGHDSAEAYILLQRRWEDSEGNIYAKRVGTGREHFSAPTPGWVNTHSLPVHYGDITSEPFYKPFMGLLDGDRAYYATNSRGQMVPVHEIGWDSPDATPTHLLVMFSSGSGQAYIGTPGLTLGIDNVSLEY